MNERRWEMAVMLIVVMALALPAAAVDRFWRADVFLSGDFDDPLHWIDGDTLGLPGVPDTTVFDLAGFYSVFFAADQATDRVLVKRGLLTFDFDGTAYTLFNPASGSASVVVGETDTDSASLQVVGGTLHGQFTDVGLAPGAFGSLTVSGPDASLLNDGQLRVGFEGAGLLELRQGAAASNGEVSVGAGTGAFGDVLVTDPGTLWDCLGLLSIGKGGTGAVAITGGAHVVCDQAIIAQQLSSFGDVLVTGAASNWTILGSLDVGQTGFATMVVQDGATVTNDLFATIGTFSAFPNTFEQGVGEVVVAGPGSAWTINGDLHVGLAGIGRWTLSTGGRVVIAGDLFRGPWPAEADPPQTVIELGSAEDYPAAAIAVTGTADGFDPRIDLVGGYVPGLGDTFLVATAGAFVDPFVLDLPALPPGLAWQVFQDGTSVQLRAGRLGDVDGDDVVGITDFLAVLSNWGPCPMAGSCPWDLDADGVVGITDLLILLAQWG